MFLYILTILSSCTSLINQGNPNKNDEEFFQVTYSYEKQKGLEKNIHESSKYQISHKNPKLLDDFQDNVKIDYNKALSTKVLNTFSKSQKLQYAKMHFEKEDYKVTINFLKSFLRELNEEGSESRELFYQKKYTKEATLLFALSLIVSGESDKALPILESLIEYAPKWSYSYAVLSKYYFDNNAFVLSKKVSQTGIEVSIEPIKELYIFNSMSLSKLGRFEESSKTLKVGQTRYPKDKGEFLSWQAVNLMFQKKYYEGCKTLDELIRDNYDSAIVSYNKAYCLIRQKHWSDALSSIEKSIESYPDFSEFYYLKGLIKKNQGNINSAKKYFSEYLAMSKISSGYKEILKISLNRLLYED